MTVQNTLKPDDFHANYAILGAGPAGVQLAYYLSRAGIKHVLLERSDVAGGFFRRFPRHRKLISINKVHTGFDDPERNLRWDWNSLLSEDGGPVFGDVTERYFPAADSLVEYLRRFVDHHGIEIQYGFDVGEIRRGASDRRSGSPGRPFELASSDGRRVTCDRLVVATGLAHDWRPAIEGIEFCESYGSFQVDPREYVNQRVLIIGKGNSAFETADGLVETAASIHLASPNPVRMAWQTHFVGHLRAVNNNILDTYQLKSQNAVLDANIDRIERVGEGFRVTFSYAHAGEEVETLEYDRVISCTGFRFDDSCFGDDCRPARTPCGRLPLMTPEWESTSVPDMFFAGALMQSRDYKKYMSAFIHGFRYNVRSLARMLEVRYHGTSWPTRAVRASPSEVAEALLARINRSSALWQQPGFLADVVRLDVGAGSADYQEELPVDYAVERRLNSGQWLALTLEYGKDKAPNPFQIERVHRRDVEHARDSRFLHPVVRCYADGRLVDEHHVIEDLAAEWREPEHVQPLEAFVARMMQRNLAGTRHPPLQSGAAPIGTAPSGEETEHGTRAS